MNTPRTRVISPSTLITRKESTRYPGLFIKKYSKRVFFDNLWSDNPELIECRGHVENSAGELVVAPFTKVFNRGENGVDIELHENVLAVQKINGFMAAATWVPEVGEVVISTTGSLDSDFVGYAENYLNQRVKAVIKGIYDVNKQPITWLFEICHPDDPHIIPEAEGAYLIGARYVDISDKYWSDGDLEVSLDWTARDMGVFRPAWTIRHFAEVVQTAALCHHEGYVVYSTESSTSLKIKSPYYLCLKAAARKKGIMSLDKTRVDEEFYPLMNYLKSWGDEFNSMDEQTRLECMRLFLKDSQ